MTWGLSAPEVHSGGILPSEQMIALISTHNSITTKHYANGKHEPAGETVDHGVVGEVKTTFSTRGEGGPL